MPPTIAREGVTAADVEAARRHVDELTSRHDEQLQAAHARLAEMRDANDGVLPVNADTIDQVEQLFGEADKTGEKVDQARAHLARLQVQAFGADPADRMPADTAQRRGHSPASTRAAGLSLASRLFASDEFKRVRELASQSPDPAQVYRRELRDVPLADNDETAVILSRSGAKRGGVELAETFDGSPLTPDDQRIWPPHLLPQWAPRLLDLVTIGSTTTDVVEYTAEVTEDIVVEGRAPGVDLPESEIEFERRTAEIVDRGTTLPVPERNLEDEGRLRSLLNGRLARGIRQDAEVQMIGGDGQGQNLTGLVNWSGVGTYQRASGENVADALHKGITQVRMSAFQEPGAFGLRPDTWEQLVLEKDDTGRYLHSAGALSGVNTTVWGKGAVMAHVLDEATAIVGVWEELELIVRIGLQLREFEQHADYAAKRLVLLRALWRGTSVVHEPKAFSVINLVEAQP